MGTKKHNSTTECQSGKAGVVSSSLGLSDLSETELSLYNEKVRWYHELGIAAPTRLIFDKIILDREKNC